MDNILRKKVNEIGAVDRLAGEKARNYLDTLTKPQGSLGRLEELSIQLAEITANPFPVVNQPGIAVFAADHGIANEGVSAYPQEVTAQMVFNFLQGGAGINVFGKQINALVKIVDVGVCVDLQDDQLENRKVRYGTGNFLIEDAMSKEEAIQAILHGIEVSENMIAEGVNSLIIGEMGIANTTASSAVLASIAGCDLNKIIGFGTGIDPERVQYKQKVVEQALARRKPDPNDPIDILAKVGGLEIAAMAGAVLGTAGKRVPILVDGFICTTAAIIASALNRNVKDYLIVGHQSVEPGHKVAIEFLGKKPLLNLELRLGEGTGAALAYPLVEAAARMINEMATFSNAGVSQQA
jgi:nicotinate-nucleotide--dimethylbenzimidazole phosphoribosyltransferase